MCQVLYWSLKIQGKNRLIFSWGDSHATVKSYKAQ